MVISCGLGLGVPGALPAVAADAPIADLIRAAVRAPVAPPLPEPFSYFPGQLVIKVKDDLFAVDPVGSPEQAKAAAESSTLSLADRRAFQMRVDRHQATFVRRLGSPLMIGDGGRTMAAVKDERVRRVQSVQSRFPERTARARAGAQPPDLSGIFLVEVPAADTLAAAEDFARDPHVEYAHPNYHLSLATHLPEVSYVPRDEFVTQDGTNWREGSWGQSYPDLWGLEKIRAFEAWDLFANPALDPGRGIVVADVDTGLDFTHPDIASNVWINSGEDLNHNGRVDGANTCPIPNGDFNCIDDDGNGFVDDIHGWNFTDGNNDPTDRQGHGTHCAGIIAAVADNPTSPGGASGIVGIAPNVHLMPLQIFSRSGRFGGCAAAFDAIIYLANEGADIQNTSWGGITGDCPEIEEAVEYATSLGVVVAAAAGNAAINVAYFAPAALSETLAVGASTQDDTLAPFSNRGAGIDVVAPGSGLPGAGEFAEWNILSLLAVDSALSHDPFFLPLQVTPGFIRLSGTSMAAPHVAGAAGVLLSRRPQLTIEQIRQALRASAVDVEPRGWDEQTGYGRLDLYAATALGPMPTARILSLKNEEHYFGTVPVALNIEAGQGTIHRWQLTSQPADGSAAAVTVAQGGAGNPPTFTFRWDLASTPRASYLLRLEVEDTSGQTGIDMLKIHRSLYQAQGERTLPQTRRAPLAISAGDVDGDGDNDLFLCNAAGPPDNLLSIRQQLWINDGTGRFADHSDRLPETTDGICVDSEIADFDGDGAVDLFLLRTQADQHRLLRNIGGAFDDQTAARLPVLSSQGLAFYGSAVGDVDGDGDVDILVGDPPALLINDGTGVFSDQRQERIPWLVPCPDSANCSIHLVDIDRDGDLDLIYDAGVGINRGDGVFIMGQGTFTAEYFSIGDINGDAFPDIVFSDSPTRTVQVRLNDGTGGFPDAPVTLVSDESIVPHLVDLDRDCDLDLLVTSDVLLHPLRAFLNDGTGTFAVAPGEEFLRPFAAVSSAVVDTDGGYEEVVLPAVWDQSVVLKARWDDFPLCVGDCDGDGKVDVSELVRLVDIALETQPLCRCGNGDATADARITIAELVRAVGNGLTSCEHDLSSQQHAVDDRSRQ